MEEIEKRRHRFGLVGKDISYSFSKGYFTEKFEQLGLSNHSYENFDLEEITAFKNINTQKDISGLNVTIPYKEAIIPYLDKLDGAAKAIGAVNTIKFTKDGSIGYNTDAYGFKASLAPLLKEYHKKALILGTGGASKAIAFVLMELGIEYQYVSRNPSKNQLNYSDLKAVHFKEFQVVVNCSPVGTYPNINEKPRIPYSFFNQTHILFDLIYNPQETAFLSSGKEKGATVQNGLPMLKHQAEKAWEIWNSK
jgi:shikimate dehydrogenase